MTSEGPMPRGVRRKARDRCEARQLDLFDDKNRLVNSLPNLSRRRIPPHDPLAVYSFQPPSDADWQRHLDAGGQP